MEQSVAANLVPTAVGGLASGLETLSLLHLAVDWALLLSSLLVKSSRVYIMFTCTDLADIYSTYIFLHQVIFS
jgi:hypothetical protein